MTSSCKIQMVAKSSDECPYKRKVGENLIQKWEAMWPQRQKLE